ncbi:8139_t:CDS:1, partial [Funneliformis geosporum]
ASGYQALSEILNNPLWGRKFYNEEQQTYVILFDDLPQHLKKNPLAIATCVAENFNKRHRSKYNPRKVIVEWKIKVEKDAKENYCEVGFIYMYFWVKQI